MIEILFDTIITKAQENRGPSDQAFFAMVHLRNFQLFVDGKKSVSRLATNLLLFQRNLVPNFFVDVSEADYTDGILAILELNGVRILQEVIIQSDERSSQLKTVVHITVGDSNPLPDEIPTSHRQTGCGNHHPHQLRPPQVVAHLRPWTEKSVIESARIHFVAAAEATFAGVHAGNFVYLSGLSVED